MTQQHKDILTIIERHGPISTSEICEHLSMLGYGGAMSWQDFRGSISKQLCYLRDKGDIAGEDKPQAKGKPMRVWALAKAQEMASDMAEVELVATLDSLDTVREIQERQAVAETVTPEPTVSVDVKVEHKPRLSAEQLIKGYKDAGSQGNMLVCRRSGICRKISRDKPMKPIIEIICTVAQSIAIAVLTGAIVGVFFGSAYLAFQWVME